VAHEVSRLSAAWAGHGPCTGAKKTGPGEDIADVTGPRSASLETILVVDDEIQVLAFIAELLRGQGYGVESTWDPDEGLRLARAHAGPLHLLLTDLVMPGMTGQELAREIHAIHPETKVLFMSAYDVEIARDYEVSLAPGEPFLTKPFSIAGLQQMVRAALEYEPPSVSQQPP
jgi:two-component system cell cycle sensor histidine kinase/response regulator CckA